MYATDKFGFQLKFPYFFFPCDFLNNVFLWCISAILIDLIDERLVHTSSSLYSSRFSFIWPKILMEHISEPHFRTCFWWHTDTWSRQKQLRAMFLEFLASSFTKHDWVGKLHVGLRSKYSSIFKGAVWCNTVLIPLRRCWYVRHSVVLTIKVKTVVQKSIKMIIKEKCSRCKFVLVSRTCFLFFWLLFHELNDVCKFIFLMGG